MAAWAGDDPAMVSRSPGVEMRATVITVEPLRSKIPNLYLVTFDITYAQAREVASPDGRVCLIGEGGQLCRVGLALRQPDELAWLILPRAAAGDLAKGITVEFLSGAADA